VDAAAFWCAATGTTLSARRGVREEFATLLAPSGDAYLKVQEVGDAGGVHIDLSVLDDHPQRTVMRDPAGGLYRLSLP